MRREIILLCGTKKTGKTTSIRELFKKVVRRWDIKEYYSQNKPGNIECDAEDFKILGDDDIRFSVSFKGNITGFASRGDDKQSVEQNCRFFEEKKCGICITACRTGGATKRAIMEWAREQKYDVSCFDFIHAEGNNDGANEGKVMLMLGRLTTLINE